MDEIPGNQNSPVNVSGKPNEEQLNQRPQYSIPGILHFIQHEWTRFEMERAQWEVERAELQARIAFLQGERKGQENLKNDLIRRIKMLEYALKQERAKFHRLKYGTEPNSADLKAPVFDDIVDDPMDGETLLSTNNVSWRQGRQLLRQYLQEIGYTDTIIDVRSARVRTLLGLAPTNLDMEEKQNSVPTVNGEQVMKRSTDTQRRAPVKKIPNSVAENALMDAEASVLATFDFLASENVDMDEEDDNLSDEMEDVGIADEDAEDRIESKRFKSKSKQGDGGISRNDDGIADAETEEVLSEFDFLGPDLAEGAGEARSHTDGSEWENSKSQAWERETPKSVLKSLEEFRWEQKRKKGGGSVHRIKRSAVHAMLASLSSANNSEDGGDITLTESASEEESDTFDNNYYDEDNKREGLNDSVIENPSFNHPSTPIVENAGFFAEVKFAENLQLPSEQAEEFSNDGSRRPLLSVPGTDEEALEAVLGLGELAGLTVNNEADTSYDISATKEAFRKTWTAKYSLRSHFDGVRALAFHPVDPVLVTASEDHTLKLWNLQKTVPAKKTASLDVEPVYTFRAHIGSVLSLAMNATGEQCFSGGQDSTIRCWNVPNSNIDPYDSFDPSVLASTLRGHTDAVWGLSIHSSKLQLLSCSADGTVRLWAPQSKVPLLHTYTTDAEDGVPTSVDFIPCEPSQMVASYTTSNAIIFDLETGKPVLRLESNQTPDISPQNKQINRIVSHPTLPMTITAHEDKNIRFFDNNTGKMVHSMVAHLDAVTSLAVDPNGLYLLSGSHDCSIRLWNMDNRTCVQEITSHRKKFDESIFDVAFHPSKPYIASAGADALAKVFV